MKNGGISLLQVASKPDITSNTTDLTTTKNGGATGIH